MVNDNNSSINNKYYGVVIDYVIGNKRNFLRVWGDKYNGR